MAHNHSENLNDLKMLVDKLEDPMLISTFLYRWIFAGTDTAHKRDALFALADEGYVALWSQPDHRNERVLRIRLGGNSIVIAIDVSNNDYEAITQSMH